MNALPEPICQPVSPLVSMRPRGPVPSLKLVEPSGSGWDELVASHPDSSFFHGTAWAQLLQASYGHRPFYLGAVDGRSLEALAPVMEVVSPLTGRRGVALPFADECSLLARDTLASRKLIGEVVDLGRRRSWRHVEFRGVRKGVIDGPPSLSFVGHSLNLSASKSRIFGGFAASVRRAIRRAERSGVGVEISASLGALRDFYKLHCQPRKRHRLPPQPFAFFRRIHEHILKPGRGCVVLTRHREQPVAAGVFFYLGEKAVYKYGASDPRRQEMRGNNLMFWEAIRWLSERGVRWLHFGRSALAQEGLRRFKLGFGSTEYGIDYYRYDLRRGRYLQGTDPAFGLHTRVFGLLPVPALRVAGALLYRHLSVVPLSLLLTI